MVVERGGGKRHRAQVVFDELSNEIDRLNKENAALRQRVQLLTHRLFGRRSEKGVPVIEQGVLPLEPAAAGPVQPETTDESQRDEAAERASLSRRHPGRRRLPADLPRERIEVVPPACAPRKLNWDGRDAAAPVPPPELWRILLQREMGPHLVIVRSVGLQNTTQVRLAEYD